MAVRRGRIILAILLTALGVSLWRTLVVERDKRQLDRAYEQSQQLVAQLTNERAHLSTELTETKHTVESQAGNISNLNLELASVQAKLDAATTQIASLQRDQEQMHQENTALTTQLSSAVAEKTALEARLSSLKELKLAIRDVRRRLWNERWADWRAYVQAQREKDQEMLALGNRGFVVQQGRSTLGANQRLQVHVLEPEESR